MEKFKKNLLIAIITLMSAVFCMTGCGDPYKNMTLTIGDSEYVESGKYYSKVIELDDLDADNQFSISATIDGVDDSVSKGVSFSVSSPTQAFKSTPTIVVNDKTTTATFDIDNVGSGEIIISSVEGNKSAKIKVTIVAKVKDYYFTHQYDSATDIVDDTKEITIEAGDSVDMLDTVTFLPSATTQKDMTLLSISDVVMEDGTTIDEYMTDGEVVYDGDIDLPYIFNGNSFVISNKEVRNVVATFGSEYLTKTISTKINMVSVIDMSLVKPCIKDSTTGEYIELTKDSAGYYTIQLAQNTSEQQNGFSKNIYFTYNDELVPYDYYLYLLNDKNAIVSSTSTAYTESVVTNGDKLDSEKFVKISQNSITDIDGDIVKLCFVNSKLDKRLAEISIKVEVVTYPEAIDIYDLNGELVSDTKPIEVYDLSAFEDGAKFTVKVLGLNSEIKLSPFTLKVVDSEGNEDSKITIYAKTRQITSSTVVNSSNQPFYIRHTYDFEQEITGTYYLVATSTIKTGEVVESSIPLKFIRGEMSVVLQYDSYAVKASDDTTQSMGVSGIAGITDMDIDQIKITVDPTLIKVLGWNSDKTAILYQALGVLGSTEMIVTAPNDSFDKCVITIYEELISATLKVMGTEIVDKESMEQGATAPELFIRTNSTVQIYFKINDEADTTDVFSGMKLIINSGSNNKVSVKAGNQLVIGSVFGKSLITIDIYGFDENGNADQKHLTFSFNVTSVVPVTSLNYTKNYSIYSNKDVSLETETVKKSATLSFLSNPSDAKLTVDEVSYSLYSSDNVKLMDMNGLSDLSDSFVWTKENKKLYSRTDSDYSIYVLIDPSNIKSIEVWANIYNSTNLRFYIGINIDQTFLNISGTKDHIIYNSAFANFEIKTVQKVESLQVLGLTKGQLNFDLRDIGTDSDGKFVSGNKKTLIVSVGPSNAINKSITVFALKSSTGYIDITVKDMADANYKEVTIELLSNFNGDDYFPDDCISIEIGTVDSKLGDTTYGTFFTFGVYLDDGSESSPYKISSASELDSIRYSLSSHYVLSGNINLSTYIANHDIYSVSGWTPIGSKSAPFTGSLKGSQTYYNDETVYYTISGLSVSYLLIDGNNGYAGLFGYVTGALTDVTLTNMTIRVAKDKSEENYKLDNIYIGGVVGCLNSNASGLSVSDRNDEVNVENISESYIGITFNSTGSALTEGATRKVYIGGVAGYVARGYTLSNSKANISINAKDNKEADVMTIVYIGGLVGYSDAIIDNSGIDRSNYVIDDVNVVINPNANDISNNDSAIGGVVGYSTLLIRKVYVSSYIRGNNNIGGVVGILAGSVNNCLSNPHIYGLSNIGGVVGKADNAKSISDNTIDMTTTTNIEYMTHIRGTNYVGGLVGYFTANDSTKTSINKNGIYTYSTSADLSSTYLGDLVLNGTSTDEDGDGEYTKIYAGGLIGCAYNDSTTERFDLSENFAYLNAYLVDTRSIYGGLVGGSNLSLTISDTHTGGVVVCNNYDEENTNIASFVTGTNAIKDSYSTMWVKKVSDNVSVSALGSDTDLNADSNVYNFMINDTTIDAFITGLGTKIYDAGSDSNDVGLKDGDTSFGGSIWYRNNDAYKFTTLDNTVVGLPINIRSSSYNGSPELTLVVNIPPTGIVLEKLGSVSVSGAYMTENNKDIVLSYSKISDSHYVSGKVTFPNIATTGNLVDSYREKLNTEISNENTYLLKDIVNLYALPKFIGTSKTKISSSNNAVLSVGTKVVDGATEIVLISNGVGQATITAVSAYDEDITASVTITVVSKYNSFDCFSDEELDSSVSGEDITIVKGYSTAIYSSFKGKYDFTSNLYSTSFDYTSYSGRGVRYTLSFDDEDSAKGFADSVLFNGKKPSVKGTQVSIDIDALSVVIEGNSATEPVAMTMTPYIIVGNDKAIFGESKQANIQVINGTKKVSIYNNETDLQIEPNANVSFEVVIDTDNMNEKLYYTIGNGYGEEVVCLAVSGGVVVDKLSSNTGLMKITCVSRIENSGNSIVTYKFSVEVNKDYLIDSTTKHLSHIIEEELYYNLHFFVVSPNVTTETNNGEISFIKNDETVSASDAKNTNVDYVSSVNISVLPQELSDSSLLITNYPFDAVENDGEYSFDVGSMSDIIMPSKISLLRIDVSPMYSNFSDLTLTSTMSDITLIQMLKNSDGKYVRVDTIVPTITNGIKISKVSGITSGLDRYFDGSIYVYCLIPTKTTENTTVTFTVNALSGETVKATTNKTLTVIVSPYIDLKYRGVEDGVIARGTTTTISADILGFDGAIDFSDSYITMGESVINNAFSTAYASIKDNGNNTYDIWLSSALQAGAVLNVKAFISKVAYGKTLTSSDTLSLLATDFVVDSISVENVSSGNFTGRFNQPYELQLVLSCTYNEYISGIADRITNLAQELSKVQNGYNVWYQVDGSTNNSLSVKTYSTFDITEENSVYSIRGIVLNSTEKLKAKATIAYSASGVITISDLDNIANYKYTLDSGVFGLGFYRYTDEENPVPILNATQFASMEAGTDYILMADITLTEWNPIDTDINSLDGNGYVITIDSFNTAEVTSTNFGLFSTVQKGSVLKNLVVEILPKDNDSVREKAVSTASLALDNATSTFDRNITFTSTLSSINFGVIAGNNLGSITNCEVTFDAYEYRNQRYAYLKGGNSYTFGTSEEEYNTKYGDKSYNNKAYSTRYSTSMAVNTDTTSASMGVLVGLNSGYITNSRVSNISMFGYGYVGGLVGTNNGKITSSYYYGGNIQNEATASDSNAGTAGLVAVNNSGATIEYSYVSGRETYTNATYDGTTVTTGTKSNDITGITDKSNFVGSNYSLLEDKTAELYRAMNSAISANTRSAGFVFENAGTITNSYSNILVNGSSSAGFVFINSGDISDVYSLSSIRQANKAHSPFTGRDVTNNYEYLNTGSITYAHYLKISSGNIKNEKGNYVTYTGDSLADEDAGESTEYADAIDNTQFQNYSTFSGYAFNEDFNENSYSSISTAVWFIPNTNSYDDGAISSNFKTDFTRTNYVFGRPELVSANLRTVSIRVFSGNNVTEDNIDSILEFNYYYKSSPDGESPSNPYLISDAGRFDELVLSMSNAANTNKSANDETNAITLYARFISDISYDEDTLCNTYNVKFSGVIDGNGMNIEGLRITAKQDSDPNDSSVITSVGNENLGLFGEIVSVTNGDNTIRGVVKNLNIDVTSIYGSGVNYVGTLAGKITDSSVYNVNVTSSSGAIIEGGKIVGGVFGLIEGNSEIVNVSASVSVTSYNKTNNNDYSSTNYYGTILKYNTYDDQKVFTDGVRNAQNVSYVGGVAGVVNVTARGNQNISYEGGDTRNSRVRKIKVDTTDTTIALSGENVGGIFGYVGSTSNVSDLSFIVNSGTKFYASRSAGGVVAENHGTIERSFAQYTESMQSSIDNYYGTNYAYSSTNYQELFGDIAVSSVSNRNAHYIGGLVGANIGGTIHNCYSKVQVYSHDSIVAGGLVGLALTGKISQSYASGSVGSNRFIGGLIGLVVTADMASNVSNQNYIYFNVNTDLITAKVTTVRNETPYLINGFSNLTIEKVVANNAWKSSDVELSKKGTISFGSLIGYICYNPTVNADTTSSIYDNDKKYAVVTESSESTRKKNDVNYSVKVSVTTGSSTTTIPEVGNITETMYTGGYVSYFKSSQSFRFYLYNDLGQYGSQRSLQSIVSREFLYQDIAYTTWEKYAWESDEEWFPKNDDTTLTDIAKSFAKTMSVAETTTAVRDIKIGIYQSSVNILESVIYKGWTQVYWEGTSVSSVGTDGLYLPALKQENYKNTIEVYTEDDLLLMQENLTSDFVLMNDIYLTSEWVPVGTESAPFMGGLYSNPNVSDIYTISNLEITSSEKNIGLFGVVSSANLHDFNVALSKIDISTGNNVSVLVAKAVKGSSATILSNIAITNVKDNKATISAGDVTTFGALLGYGEYVIIENCTACVNGEKEESAFEVNIKSMTTMTSSGAYVNTSTVNSKNASADVTTIGIGGLVGYVSNFGELTTSIEDTSYASYMSHLSASDIKFTIADNGVKNMAGISIGGVVGDSTGMAPQALTYKNTYGNTRNMGGIYSAIYSENGKEDGKYTEWGVNSADLSNCYALKSTGMALNVTLTGGNNNNGRGINVGGAIGNYSSIYNYNNESASKVTLDGLYVSGLTLTYSNTATQDHNYIGGVAGTLSSGIDITNITVTGTNAISYNITSANNCGAIDIGGVAGSIDLTRVTAEDTTSATLSNVIVDSGTSIVSTNDSTEIQSTSANVGGLAGKFNGDSDETYTNVAIDNLHSSSNLNVGGMFGATTGGTISNAYTTGTIDIKRSSYRVGGLVGYSISEISKSNSTTNINIITSFNMVGGLVGSSENTIDSSVSSGVISLDDDGTYAGGLVGCSTGGITDSVSYSTIKSDCGVDYLGGLVGDAKCNITNCYSTGYIDSVQFDGKNVGGLVGQLDSGNTMSNSYTMSRFIYRNNKTAYLSTIKGGLVGNNVNPASDSKITNSFYIKELTPYSSDMYSGYGISLEDYNKDHVGDLLGKLFTLDCSDVENLDAAAYSIVSSTYTSDPADARVITLIPYSIDKIIICFDEKLDPSNYDEGTNIDIGEYGYLYGISNAAVSADEDIRKTITTNSGVIFGGAYATGENNNLISNITTDGVFVDTNSGIIDNFKVINTAGEPTVSQEIGNVFINDNAGFINRVQIVSLGWGDCNPSIVADNSNGSMNLCSATTFVVQSSLVNTERNTDTGTITNSIQIDLKIDLNDTKQTQQVVVYNSIGTESAIAKDSKLFDPYTYIDDGKLSRSDMNVVWTLISVSAENRTNMLDAKWAEGIGHNDINNGLVTLCWTMQDSWCSTTMSDKYFWSKATSTATTISDGATLYKALTDKSVETINVANDIDLSYRLWDLPVIKHTKTINGQGHTISNMSVVNVNAKADETYVQNAGFISNVEGSASITINQLAIKDGYAISGSTTGTFIGEAHTTGSITLSEVYASGVSITGPEVGGLVGYMELTGGTENNTIEVSNSYIMKDMSFHGNEGKNVGLVFNVAKGTIKLENVYAPYSYDLFKNESGKTPTITNAYKLGTDMPYYATGNSSVTSLSTSGLLTYDLGFDWTKWTRDNSKKINNGYPYLKWQGDIGFWSDIADEASYDGDSLYEIDSPNQLAWLINRTGSLSDYIVKLVSDIDLAGHYWTPITVSIGVFDFNGHTISNMMIINTGTSSGIGLFGTNVGTIKNAKMENSIVYAKNSSNVGILCGESEGKIYDSYIYSTDSSTHSYVTGASNVGGLVGYNSGSGLIQSSDLNSIYVTGKTNIGGLVGTNSGIIQETYISNDDSRASSYVLTHLDTTQDDIESLPNIYLGGAVGYNSGKVYETVVALANVQKFYYGRVGDSNANLSGTSRYIGGVIGYSYTTGIVRNAYIHNLSSNGLSDSPTIGTFSNTENISNLAYYDSNSANKIKFMTNGSVEIAKDSSWWNLENNVMEPNYSTILLYIYHTKDYYTIDNDQKMAAYSARVNLRYNETIGEVDDDTIGYQATFSNYTAKKVNVAGTSSDYPVQGSMTGSITYTGWSDKADMISLFPYTRNISISNLTLNVSGIIGSANNTMTSLITNYMSGDCSVNNLKVNTDSNYCGVSASEYASILTNTFAGWLNTLDISNVTVNNVTLMAKYAGTLVGYNTEAQHISLSGQNSFNNISVTSSSTTGFSSGGILFGRLNTDGNLSGISITGCSILSGDFAKSYAGLVAGYINMSGTNTKSINEISIESSKVIMSYPSELGTANISVGYVGGAFGRFGLDTSVSVGSISMNQVIVRGNKNNRTGGFIGYVDDKAKLTISNIKNYVVTAVLGGGNAELSISNTNTVNCLGLYIGASNGNYIGGFDTSQGTTQGAVKVVKFYGKDPTVSGQGVSYIGYSYNSTDTNNTTMLHLPINVYSKYAKWTYLVEGNLKYSYEDFKIGTVLTSATTNVYGNYKSTVKIWDDKSSYNAGNGQTEIWYEAEIYNGTRLYFQSTEELGNCWYDENGPFDADDLGEISLQDYVRKYIIGKVYNIVTSSETTAVGNNYITINSSSNNSYYGIDYYGVTNSNGTTGSGLFRIFSSKSDYETVQKIPLWGALVYGPQHGIDGITVTYMEISSMYINGSINLNSTATYTVYTKTLKQTSSGNYTKYEWTTSGTTTMSLAEYTQGSFNYNDNWCTGTVYLSANGSAYTADDTYVTMEIRLIHNNWGGFDYYKYVMYIKAHVSEQVYMGSSTTYQVKESWVESVPSDSDELKEEYSEMNIADLLKKAGVTSLEYYIDGNTYTISSTGYLSGLKSLTYYGG